jgi:SAM-dependent methyltransferase
MVEKPPTLTEDFLWPHLLDLPYARAMLRAVEARMYQKVALPGPVLDLGTGDGHFASVAFSRPLDLGVDPQRGALGEAKPRRGYRLLVQADGAGLPLADRSIGSAVSNSVLEHIPALEAVLSEVWRVLRPGAPFAFTVPNPGYRSELGASRLLSRLGWDGGARWYERFFLWISRTEHLHDEGGWQAILERSGFEVERTFRYFSPQALRMLELGHYLGLPCLLPRWTTGRWILAPWRWSLWLTERIVRRYYDETPCDKGTYNFYCVRKAGDEVH